MGDGLRRRAAAKVLLVDDEAAVVRALSVALEAHGMRTVAAATGEAAVARAASEAPDVVLLDLGLPGMDGLEVIRRVRTFAPATPIIVLSAWGEDDAKVRALDLGADDYVVKPFAMPELLARVRVALRHRERMEGGEPVAGPLRFGDLEIDPAERTVRRAGDDVRLTPTQFDLLLLFARHPGRLLTHRMIGTEVWGASGDLDAANLRVVVSQLRRRLGDDSREPRIIATELGVGYRFVA
jgi:two-component system KDP operon response regulator KdpE